MPARDTSPNGRDRAREKDRDRYRERPRSRDRDQDRARGRERDKDRDRGRAADADRDRDRKRDRAKEKDERERYREPSDAAGRDRPRSRDRSRDHGRAKGAEIVNDTRRRHERAGDERARSHGARERGEERHREAPRAREEPRERDRDREKDRTRERVPEKRSRAEHPDPDARERKPERAARDGDRSGGSRADGSRHRERDSSAKEKAEKKPMTDEERQVLERRKRVEAWQKKKRAMEEEAARADEEAAASRKKWTLDDDGTDDEEPPAQKPEGGMEVDEDDELDRFMQGVGTQVKEDLAAIDPAVARDAVDVNPQLARAGIDLDVAAFAVTPDAAAAAATGDAPEGADADMADAGSAAAAPAVAAAAEGEGSAGDGGRDGGGVEPAAVAAGDADMADTPADRGSAQDAVDTGAAVAAAPAGAAAPTQEVAAVTIAGSSGGGGGAATASTRPKLAVSLAKKPVVQFQIKKPVAKVSAKSGLKYERKRTKRLEKAQERRKKAIERAAPKALNPYASDSDGEAAAEAEESDGEAEEAVEEEEELDDEAWAKAVQSGNLSKGERLVPVDHSTMPYPSFRKAFYIESPDITRMTAEDVAAAYIDMGGVKMRGKNAPKPVRTWAQAGLPLAILGALKRHSYREPLPIQALALPTIMSGRDCIGVATTGSGKTLGFVLPMLRHVNDQVVRGLDESLGNGPVGLVIAPTRELVQQISKEVRLFAKVMDLAVVAAYGGSGVKEQINGLKRGAHVVVCTPGRMIDILVTSNGSITNLHRVTMLVIDEADRMFDMGFEPQISRIIGQIRPDRQTVLFSATFPRQVEILARAILSDPVEIQVGGRSTVSSTIKQIVEIRADDDERFARLLEILGQHVEDTKVLVFVNSQEKASSLFQQLLNYGYPNQMLHGDMQQTDRESVISDFKTGVCSVLVATSVAARGLDVRDLGLVVNYDTPNHLEEYVHRCGRTGRAGADGTAITFLSPSDDQYSPDLVKAFRDSKLPVPADLQKLADGFKAKRKKGLARLHGSGFGGSGFKFDQHEDDVHTAIKKRHAIEYRQPGDEAAVKPDAAAAAAHQDAMQRFDDGVGGDGGRITAKYATTVEPPPEVLNISEERMKQAQRIALQAASRVMSAARVTENMGSGIRRVLPSGTASATAADTQAALVLAAQSAASKIAGSQGLPLTRGDAIKAAALAQSAAAKQVATAQPYFEADLVINDFPQAARYHVTHRDTIAHIAERTGAAIIIRGQYYGPGQAVPADDSKLYLLIEGPTQSVVKRAKELIKQIIEERTERSMRRDTGAMGRTSVV